MRIAVAAAALALLAAPAGAQTPDTDYMKRAGNFLKNCDARADASGQRPEVNYVCLGFMAGLIEGYTYAAIANGNPRPYCLPRPATLPELSDMMATVIERGVPPDLPTAAVFHFILDQNFKCAPATAEAPAAVETAQADTEPQPEGGATLPIVEPAGEAASEPQLPIVTPSEQPGVPAVESDGAGDAAATDTLPGATSQATASTPVPTPAPARTAPDAPPAPDTPATAATPARPAPVVRPGTAVGITTQTGPATAVEGPGEATRSSETGPASAIGPGTERGPDSAEGPVLVPLDETPRDFDGATPQRNPLAVPQINPAAPSAPATPAQPQRPRPPQAPAPVTAN